MSSNGVAVRGKKSSWFNGIITKKYTEYSGREIRVKHFHFLMLFMLFCISASGNAQVRHTMLIVCLISCIPHMRGKLVSQSYPEKNYFVYLVTVSYFDIFIHVVEV